MCGALMLHLRSLTAVLLPAAEYAEGELKNELGEKHFNKKHPSKAEVWKAILELKSNQELLQCVQESGRAWNGADKAANM